MEANPDRIRQDTLLFFDGHADLFPLYAALEARLLAKYPQVNIRVQKTQISFSSRHFFACVSFLRPRKKAELPASYFVLTLGLPGPLSSPRVAAQTEPYPGRWTVHIVLSTAADLDAELFGWMDRAYAFAEEK